MIPGDIRIHALLLLILFGTQAFFTVLAVRNLRYSEEMIRDERDWLTSELAMEDPDAVIDYTRIKTGFSHLQSWIGLIVLVLVLYTGLFTDAVLVIESLGYGPVLGGALFFTGLAVVLQLYSVPFDLVDTFVIEELFDFNRQPIRLWIRDAVIGLAMTIVLSAVLAGALLFVIEQFPTWWWLVGTALFLGFSLVMLVLYPRVIAPLFNEFTPIESGELRDAIESVFDRAGFRCDELYSMDASRRSSHSNAYFVGFGRTKRVVLFDTLIEHMQIDEIQSVLAHELAHWKRRHIWKRMLPTTIRTAAVLFVLWGILQSTWVFDLFALPAHATYAGLLVGLLFINPLMRFSAPLTNRQSLAHEREADRFAVEVMGDSEPMVGALTGLADENLSNPFPDPLYATFHYSHPPIPERIRILREAASSPDGD